MSEDRPPLDPQHSFLERGGLWVLVQAGLLAAVAGLAVKFPGARPRLGFIVPGALLLALGGAVGLAGALALRANLTPFPRPRADSDLVQHGIYARVRHPLYTSVMLASLGWALAWQSLPALAVALALVPFFHAKARREERWLRAQFPGYADYEKRVKRFVPWVC